MLILKDYFSELSGGDHGQCSAGKPYARPTKLHPYSASLLGVYRAVVPPDPIPNSEVKRSIADGSVGLPHVRVGQRQVLIQKLCASTELLFSECIAESNLAVRVAFSAF